MNILFKKQIKLITLLLAITCVYGAGDLLEHDGCCTQVNKHVVKKSIVYNVFNKLSNVFSNIHGYFLPSVPSVPYKQVDFEEVIKQPTFHVPVSSNSLAKMHKVSTLLIACVDFRLQDEKAYLMEKIFGLSDNYDEISLPGAALAMVANQFEKDDLYDAWAKSVEGSIKLLKKLHDFERVIFLDHRDCGAYKLIGDKKKLSTDYLETEAHKETKAHKEKFLLVRRLFVQDDELKKLKVYTLLMGLDGKVDNFSF